jgi:hypothetical protein
MSKIIYYLGAGASFGRREYPQIKGFVTEEIAPVVTEGVPVVSELALYLRMFEEAVSGAKIEDNREYVFGSTYPYSLEGEDLCHKCVTLARDIEIVRKATEEHATIDTYAKKLFLTKRMDDFRRLKNVLCAFFVWAQLNAKADQRYDTFLANILQQEDLNFPESISVISWNYDSQFEIAYKAYSSKKLPLLEKNNEKDLIPIPNIGQIFKVNGSATFGDFNAVNSIINDSTVPQIIQIIEYYDNISCDTHPCGFQFKSHLSFAWESSQQQANLMKAIEKATMDTESVVVIGYSFPYFNREIDRQIFSMMHNLKTIYIQDPNPEAVEPSLRAVLPLGQDVSVVYQKNCNQFYLPREL